MDCPECGSSMMNYGVENCCPDCGTLCCNCKPPEVDITKAEHDRLLAVEAEYQRLRAEYYRVAGLACGICDSAMKAIGSDGYEVQRLRAAVKQIRDLLTIKPAVIARAKGEGK